MKIASVGLVNSKIDFYKQNKAIKNENSYPQNSSISNVYYQPINFARKWSEHQSWGVRLQKDGSASVKIFSFPDAKNVSIELNNEKVYPLQKKDNGIFESRFESGVIKEGDKYQFVIEKKDGVIEKVKDPYSFNQPDLLGQSVVYDHNRYSWQDEAWFDSENKNRISRLANSKNSLTPLEGAKIYELNVATLTQKGNFEGVVDELQRIKDTGFNAIEIMPVENTYSYNWGYDGVDKFAVATYMGGPDKLKELVDSAHKIGLNVIMDMVPNHLGPDGAQLHKAGPYIGGSTPWGGAFNYEGKDSRYVRDYIVNAALNWIHNYHCDGLRLDMTQHMKSDITMQQIAAEVNYHFPDAFLIAEDGREKITVRGDDFWHDPWQPHDERVIIPLKDNESGIGQDENAHDITIDKISEFKVPLSRLGFDSEWDFHFYHALTKLAYGGADLDALERAIAVSGTRVKYSTSHDETGNMDGTRVVAKYMVPMLNLNEYTYLDSNDMERAKEYVQLKGGSIENAMYVIKSQKAQQNSMQLAQMVQNGKMEDFASRKSTYFQKYVLDYLGIDRTSFITPKKVLSTFSEATKIYRAIEALKYFTPGPVMTFQGEENLDMTKFNFFREFESIKDERYLYLEKGYPNGIEAYLESKMGHQEYCKQGKARMAQFEALIKDLNKFKDENPSSTVGKVIYSNTIKHFKNPTIALHAKDEESKNETFIVSNFSNVDYPIYGIEFPKGKWAQIINTNDKKYGGSGTCQNNGAIYGYGDLKIKSNIALPAKSSIIFKKV